jgi:hypothetical protein
MMVFDPGVGFSRSGSSERRGTRPSIPPGLLNISSRQEQGIGDHDPAGAFGQRPLAGRDLLAQHVGVQEILALLLQARA